MSASEIIKELPKLSEAERQAVLDKLRELAQVDDDRWEEIINEPTPRPKLRAFIEQATAEGSEPLGAFGKRTSNSILRKKERHDVSSLYFSKIPGTIRFNSKNYAATRTTGR